MKIAAWRIIALTYWLQLCLFSPALAQPGDFKDIAPGVWFRETAGG